MEKTTVLNKIPVDQWLTDRWDREWINYFMSEDARLFFIPYDQLKKKIKNISTLQSSQIFDSVLYTSKNFQILPLHIWVDGRDIVNKNILEIGCGPGYLGKQIASFSRLYLGIDYSEFALSIARLTSPGNCHYLHISDFDGISKYFKTMDTMVGREFFIHQNYQNALWVMGLAYLLLKSGGLIGADFYLGNPKVAQGIIHPAKSSLDTNYASCAFQFSKQDIDDIAKETGFEVESVTDRLDLQRRFVHFRRN